MAEHSNPILGINWNDDSIRKDLMKASNVLSELNQLIAKSSRDIIRQREAAIKERLKAGGFEFETDQDFYQFVKDRLTLATPEDKPDIRELYLDFNTPNQTLVTWWSEAVTFTQEGGKFSITVG